MIKDYFLQVLVAATVGAVTVLFGAGWLKSDLSHLQATSRQHDAAIVRIDSEGSTKLKTVVEADQRRLDTLERTMTDYGRQLSERTATEQALLREMTALRQELREMRK